MTNDEGMTKLETRNAHSASSAPLGLRASSSIRPSTFVISLSSSHDRRENQIQLLCLLPQSPRLVLQCRLRAGDHAQEGLRLACLFPAPIDVHHELPFGDRIIRLAVVR